MINIDSGFNLYYSNLEYQYHNKNTSEEIIGLYFDFEEYYTKKFLNKMIYDYYDRIPLLPKSITVQCCHFVMKDPETENNIYFTAPYFHHNPYFMRIIEKIVNEKELKIKFLSWQFEVHLLEKKEIAIYFTNEERSLYNKIKHFLENPYLLKIIFNDLMPNLISINPQNLILGNKYKILNFVYDFMY